MNIAALTIKLYAPWVHSLKEKRMVVKSLLEKITNKFNVSASETDEQDTHQTIVIGIAAIAADRSHADSIMDNVINFVERTTDAELISYEREFL
jgi:uncharacterized protein YlxP (DUF503 family)